MKCYGVKRRKCEFPNCPNYTPLNTVRGKHVPRRWCYHHLDGAGQKERVDYSKGVILRNSNYKHGMTKTKPHMVWLGLKQRCTNPKHISYKWYGAKGIRYPAKWNMFCGFWDDMKHSYKEGLTIDRIDNTKSYSKDNCRWVTLKEQLSNTSRSRFLTFNGKTQTVTEWERELGFKRGVISQRLNTYKWPIKKALTTKSRTKAFCEIVGITSEENLPEIEITAEFGQIRVITSEDKN